MKKSIIAAFVSASLLPLSGFAQTPPTPPVPAVPPAPPAPPSERGDRAPKVPVTFLGVETSDVPTVVADQLGLPKGFGLVVDYVVPDGPAAAAGVQQNDILKMLNDQILTEPDQLSKLIRSFPEGTTVTLTVLRKGAETKLTARLGKHEVPQHRGMMMPGGRHGHDFGQLGEEMNQLGEKLGNMNFGNMAPEYAERVREEVRNAQREAREATREAMQQAREAAREFRITRQNNGALKTTHIDMDKAQIVFHDAQGELKIERVAGKKVLTAKDPQGRLVFSGPVETKEELDKLPADVRQRYDKLEQKDLPTVAPVITRDQDMDDSEDDHDNDEDNGDGADTQEVLSVVRHQAPANSYRTLKNNTILI
jgi:serine protease Do